MLFYKHCPFYLFYNIKALAFKLFLQPLTQVRAHPSEQELLQSVIQLVLHPVVQFPPHSHQLPPKHVFEHKSTQQPLHCSEQPFSQEFLQVAPQAVPQVPLQVFMQSSQSAI